ncbi:MAG: GNAT family N-acetyltransferase [Treponema sp.]|jgi:GNAT superfamily N-acetyltransferase|nr:GNAT family N-acetyltransferase [Treponema sp.]
MKKYRVNEHILFRFAEPEDVPLILEFVRSLAEYEKLPDSVEAAEANFRKYIFDEKMAEVIIAEYDGESAGFALFFRNFSTFVGKPGLYLEDLFVKPACRGRGLGKLFLAFLAKLAADRGYGRFEWACLDWNEPSIEFYKSRGARPMNDWTIYRVAGEALETLGKQFPEAVKINA